VAKNERAERRLDPPHNVFMRFEPSFCGGSTPTANALTSKADLREVGTAGTDASPVTTSQSISSSDFACLDVKVPSRFVDPNSRNTAFVTP
jgi:hypothetical protein